VAEESPCSHKGGVGEGEAPIKSSEKRRGNTHHEGANGGAMAPNSVCLVADTSGGAVKWNRGVMKVVGGSVSVASRADEAGEAEGENGGVGAWAWCVKERRVGGPAGSARLEGGEGSSSEWRGASDDGAGVNGTKHGSSGAE
jgi:hypothetical protein